MSDAEERAWEVVRRAFEERPPRARPGSGRFAATLLAAAVAAALVGAFLTGSGHAVFERFRQAVGVEHAAPALFSLPSSGRLLVVSGRGRDVWIVDADGLKRRLGGFDDADWSPHGLYVVATRGDELVALDPHGKVHWTLSRRDPRTPRWEGTRVDTRIAYDSASGLRVVAGDGTGDHLLDAAGGAVPPAWDPARLHTLAYYAHGAIVVRRDDGRLLRRTRVPMRPASLVWSSDGRYLAAVAPRRILVLDAAGRVHRTVSELDATVTEAAFAPGSHRLAVSLRLPGRSEVQLVDVDRRGSTRLVFAGPGVFGDLAWSPDGRWLLVTWPTADQWVFLHGTRAHAVANIRAQFGGSGVVRPTLQLAGRWCCAR